MLTCSRRGIAALATVLALAPAAWASPKISYTAIDLGTSTSPDWSYGKGAIDHEAGVVRSGDGSLAYRFIPAQGTFNPMSSIPWSAPEGSRYDFMGGHESYPKLGSAMTLSTSPDIALYSYSYWDGRSRISGIGRADRDTDGTWKHSGTLIFGRAFSGSDSSGASILGLNSRGQVLLTANNGLIDPWSRGQVFQSEHPWIRVYDTNTGKHTSLERLLPRIPFDGFFNLRPIALDDEGRVLVRAEEAMSREGHLFLFNPSDLSAAPVPEPSTLVVLALGGLVAWRRLRTSPASRG